MKIFSNTYNPPELEKKPYREDMSKEEIELLKSQVYPLDHNIVVYKEAAYLTVPQLKIYAEKMAELTKDYDATFIIVDTSRVQQRPGASEREGITKIFEAAKNLQHVAIYIDKSVLLRVAAGFIFKAIGGIQKYSTHRTFEEGINKLISLQEHSKETKNTA